MRKASVFAAVLSAMVGSTGCGQGQPGKQTAASGSEASVSGILAIQGRAATGGQIRFRPMEGGGAAPEKAAIEPGGKFTAKALSGPNEVHFEGPGAPGGFTPRTVFIEPGDNKLDIDL